MRSATRLDEMNPWMRGGAPSAAKSQGKNDGETKSLVEMSSVAALSLCKLVSYSHIEAANIHTSSAMELIIVRDPSFTTLTINSRLLCSCLYLNV